MIFDVETPVAWSLDHEWSNVPRGNLDGRGLRRVGYDVNLFEGAPWGNPDFHLSGFLDAGRYELDLEIYLGDSAYTYNERLLFVTTIPSPGSLPFLATASLIACRRHRPRSGR